MSDDGELSAFVMSRLDEDEARYDVGGLPFLDEAWGRGRLRILRSGQAAEHLLLVPGPVRSQDDGMPVPFPERAAYLREEAANERDQAVLGPVASVCAAHPGWREHWRPTG